MDVEEDRIGIDDEEFEHLIRDDAGNIIRMGLMRFGRSIVYSVLALTMRAALTDLVETAAEHRVSVGLQWIPMTNGANRSQIAQYVSVR